MIIPYRVKNPPKRFPYATVSLIGVNFLVFALSTSGMMIRLSVVKAYAYTFPSSPIFNLLSAMFLHGDIFHIVGNMLFLWVFGPPVEDRLGIPRYLALYFFTGLIGDLGQGGLDVMLFHASQPVIGASGCIMGVVGAYWYLFPWSTVCVFYWIGWFWRGVWEIRATLVIGFYVLMDTVQGLLGGAMGVAGGVANFAHVGGALAGLLLCVAVGARKDTAEMSQARAIHSELKDLGNLPFASLVTMLGQEPHDLDLLRALAWSPGRVGEQEALDKAFEAYGPGLAVDDPALLAHYLTALNGKPGLYHAGHVLQAGITAERAGNTDQAMSIYRMVADTYLKDPAAESALYKLAACCWNSKKDANSAQKCLKELEERFPYSEMMIYARQLWNEMPRQPSADPGRRAA